MGRRAGGVLEGCQGRLREVLFKVDVLDPRLSKWARDDIHPYECGLVLSTLVSIHIHIAAA